MKVSNFKQFDLGLVIRNWLSEKGLNLWLVDTIGFITDLLIFILIVLIADYVAKRIILSFIKSFVEKTKANWDDYFYEKRVFRNLAHLIPALIGKTLVPLLFNELNEEFRIFLNRGIDVYMIVLVAIVLNKTLKALENYSEETGNKLDSQQIRTISQVMRILIVFIAIVTVFSIVFDIHVGKLLGGLAGATAIIILIFQDTINGLLANLQINMYDLIKKGDWITFSKYGVDGNVVSIDLTTVKVQNWDKTISSVPAKAFVFDSFVNWRGMQETKARRIKRNILIDINSIKYADKQLLHRLNDVQLVANYVKETQVQIEQFNTENTVNTEVLINGRNQTNIGIYRAYILEYLKNHPGVDQNLTLMVRQLQPTPEGIPLEVYCFSNDINWVNYEGIQSDIFDHLYAATSYFDLELYQAPSGNDFKTLSKH